MRAWLMAVAMIASAGQAGAQEVLLNVEGDPNKGWSIIRLKDEITDGPVIFAGLRSGGEGGKQNGYSSSNSAVLICRRGNITLMISGLAETGVKYDQLVVGVRYDQKPGKLVSVTPISVTGRTIVFDSKDLLDAIIDGASSSETLLLQIDGRGTPLFNGAFPATNGVAAITAIRETCP